MIIISKNRRPATPAPATIPTFVLPRYKKLTIKGAKGLDLVISLKDFFEYHILVSLIQVSRGNQNDSITQTMAVTRSLLLESLSCHIPFAS